MIRFIIPGEPVSKGRPRVTKWVTYTPDKTVNYDNLVKFSFIEQCKKKEKIEGPISMHITFFFKIPKRTSKKNIALMEEGKILPTKRPDIDNCIKSITDALNEFAYDDDSQIVSITAKKFYSAEPRAEVKLLPIKEMEVMVNE